MDHFRSTFNILKKVFESWFENLLVAQNSVTYSGADLNARYHKYIYLFTCGYHAVTVDVVTRVISYIATFIT